MKCPKCAGNGKVYGNGPGGEPNVFVPCDRCAGTTEVAGVQVQCAACAGAGYHIPGAGPETHSSKAGEVEECRKCGGTGLMTARDTASSPSRRDTPTTVRKVGGKRPTRPDGACADRQHEPDLTAAYEPGAYEHACPSCGASAEFEVTVRRTDAPRPAKIKPAKRGRGVLGAKTVDQDPKPLPDVV